MRLKTGIIVLTILLLLTGCCGVTCKQKRAGTIIEKVEKYKQETGKLPESLGEIGMDDRRFEYKMWPDRYWLHYEGRFGQIHTYNSMKKEWSRMGSSSKP